MDPSFVHTHTSHPVLFHPHILRTKHGSIFRSKRGRHEFKLGTTLIYFTLFFVYNKYFVNKNIVV